MQKSFAILTAFLIASASASSVIRREDTTKTCQEFDTRDPTKASCDSRPDQVCTKGCTGGVVSQNCTLVLPLNATKEAIAKNAPVASVTCTKGFGKSSAISYTCSTDKDHYTCTGPSSGSAICSGCVPNGVQLGNVSATTPNATNSTNNYPDASASPSTNASSSGTPKPSDTKSTGGTTPTSDAHFVGSGSVLSACAASIIAGAASLVL